MNNWSIELCETKQTASTNDFSLQQMAIYPNPFKSNFTISFIPNTSENILITLYDLRGRTINKKKFINPNSIFREEFDYKNLATGVYILNVQQGRSGVTRKIIKY